MARYMMVDMSPQLPPVDLDAQLISASFAHAVHHVVGTLDLSAFDAHYRNISGAGAVFTLCQARSIRPINCTWPRFLFIALTGYAKPHFTPIADFVSRSDDAIASVLSPALTRMRNTVRFICFSPEMNPALFPC